MSPRKQPPAIKKFDKRMRTNLMVLFSFIVVLLLVMFFRTLYLIAAKGEEYSQKFLAMQGYNSVDIPYQRGDILDANGTVLATSIDYYNVVLDVALVLDDEKYLEPTIAALKEYFDIDESKLRNYISEKPGSHYYVVKYSQTAESVKQFDTMLEETDEKGSKLNPYVKGVTFEKKYERSYPMGTLASAVLGFVNSSDNGVSGLESYYNSTLSGINGREYGYLNSDSLMEKNVVSATDGYTLVTTLDANIQSIVESKIREFYDDYSCNYREDGGFDKCGVIIMDPNNGEIKAMASYPTFDANDPNNLDSYYTAAQQDAMTSEEKSTALNELWQNFTVSSTFEPGSVQKPLTIATGLETGTISEDMTFFCDGFEEISGQTIKCVKIKGHGEETVEQALMDSCNDSLMQMAALIGIDNFTSYQTTFGFGQRTGIDLPSEATAASLMYTADTMSQIDLVTNAFGQNFNCSMIQMIAAHCSLVNGGTYYQPHLVSRVLDTDGNTISTVNPMVVKQTVSEETSATIRRFMKSVVDEGTGTTAKVDGYSMGGKTGTAEKLNRDKENYVVSFIGCVPAENPQLVIYCVIDSPNVKNQSHSYYAQNVVREILEEVLPYMGIQQDEETTGINAGYDVTGENPPKYQATISEDSVWADFEPTWKAPERPDTDTDENSDNNNRNNDYQDDAV